MEKVQNAVVAATCLAYTGVVIAFMFSFWGIAIAVTGLFFLMIISVLQSQSILLIVPNAVTCLLSSYYMSLCYTNRDKIKNDEMPHGWNIHHLFVIFFLLLAVLCLQFDLGFGMCAVPLSFMFLFVVMQYTLAVNFRTDG
jgi:hypothetical protein